MKIREIIEARETNELSSRATLSSQSKGREKKEKPCDIRTEFQRDRDRIIHSKAFRRLMHKTQVFIAPEKDHYRTRLTHALEVAQISRTLARALRLNEDLTEAIALGHDLGHTPFGHIGEDALTECLKEARKRGDKVPEPFKHNWQSLRVVNIVEKKGLGLNLTREVKDGILNHTGKELPFTLEGQIVRIADRIAYVNHDIDDSIRAGVIKQEDLPEEPLKILGKTHSERIDRTVRDIIETSGEEKEIKMSPKFDKALASLRGWLFDAVYLNPEAKSEDEKAKQMLKMLFWHYYNEPGLMPKEFHPTGNEEVAVRVCDYVAGMTDRYALNMFEEIFIPGRWMV